MNPLLKGKTRQLTILTAAYLGFALAVSYPLVLHFREFYFSGNEDGAMSVWNLWWMKFSLMELGINPLDCKYLFFPDGVNLVYHSLPKLLGIISIPLQSVFSLAATYNLILLFTFVGTGLTTYWLAYKLIGERTPAFIAGLVFAFSPVRIDHRSHLQLMATVLLPVFIILLMNAKDALEKREGRAWAYFSLAGLVLAGVAYDTEYYAVFLAMFAALFFIFYLPRQRSREQFGRWLYLLLGLLLTAIVFIVLFSPILYAAAREAADAGNYATFSAGASKYHAADVLSFFTPNENSDLLGPLFKPISGKFLKTDTTFLGLVPIFLGLVGAWRYRREQQVRLWLLVALAFAILALGPFVVVLGKITGIFAPYVAITQIPVLNTIRVPSRFIVMVALAVSILAGYGARAFISMLGKQGRRQLAVTAFTVICALLFFIETKPLPEITSLEVPDAYRQIAASGSTGSVITMPLGWEGGNISTGQERTYTQLFQTVHEKPMVGGMVARAATYKLMRGEYQPVLDFLSNPVDLEPSDLDLDEGAVSRMTERYQVDFIVIQKRSTEVYRDGQFYNWDSEVTPEARQRAEDYIVNTLGMEKFTEDEDVVAFRRR